MKINKIVLATHNQKKVGDFKALLGVDNVVSLTDMGIPDDVIETGLTYEENALLKLNSALTQITEPGLLIIADDSGLEIEAMNNLPGVYSHRFMGNVSIAERNQAVIDMAVAREMFSGQYISNIAWAVTGTTHRGVVVGKVNVKVTQVPQVGRDFSYDSILVPTDYSGTETFDTMSYEERNQYSHRAAALNALVETLKNKGMSI